jgi:hypothetical protein
MDLLDVGIGEVRQGFDPGQCLVLGERRVWTDVSLGLPGCLSGSVAQAVQRPRRGGFAGVWHRTRALARGCMPGQPVSGSLGLRVGAVAAYHGDRGSSLGCLGGLA